MGRKKKNRVYVGIDGIDIKVNTTTILEQNYYAFKNKNGEEIGKNGYSRPFWYIGNNRETLKMCMFFNFSVPLKKRHMHIR